MIDEDAIAAWERATFPDATKESAFAHLCEEVVELGRAIASGNTANLGEELGDVGLLLCAVAHAGGFSLSDAIAAKFATARERVYQFDPALGYAKHVKENR